MANRQEARPLKFRDLTDSQKEAAESVAQSLLSALEDLKASPNPGVALRKRSTDWCPSRSAKSLNDSLEEQEVCK